MSMLYRWDRVGKNGESFTIFKIRTLKENTQIEEILPGRWFLRKYGLDEIPQIINLILGDMSFFGVRPLGQKEFTQQNQNFQHLYIQKKPGICWGHWISNYLWEEYTKRHDEIFLRLQKIIERKSFSKQVAFYTMIFWQSLLQVLWWHEDIDK